MRANDPKRFAKTPTPKLDLAKMTRGDRVFFENGNTAIVEGSYKSDWTGHYSLTFDKMEFPNTQWSGWYNDQGMSIDSKACQNIKSFVRITK